MSDAAASIVVNPLRVREERSNRLNFPRAFHVRLPDYAPTPLLDLPDLARELGVGRLWVKDETRRYQMRGFELLGAAWALYRDVLGRLERRVSWNTVEELRERIAPVGALRVVVVSDNHFGVAAARAARLFGFACTAYVPAELAVARLDALRDEGASVVAVPGGYDAALAAGAADTADDVVILSDSSWPGFDEIPLWVTEGYVTIFEEAMNEIGVRHAPDPDAVIVPLGVGALAAAAGEHLRTEKYAADLALIGVEPVDAACFGDSARAGHRQARPAPGVSVMQSIARGLPSPSAWDAVSLTFDAFVAVGDDDAVAAVEQLRARGVDASEAGAAAVAAAATLAQPGGGGGNGATAPRLDSTSSVLVVVTEAALVAAARSPHDGPVDDAGGSDATG